MRLNEDYIENIELDGIKLEEPKINIKSAVEYRFSLYVKNTSVTKNDADEKLEKLSNALDSFPNIYQHAEEYHTDDSDDVDFLIGLEHNIRKPAEVFRLLCIIQKFLSKIGNETFTIQARCNPWYAQIKGFNLLREYHDEGLNIGVTGFSLFEQMVAVFNKCERDVFPACVKFMNFDWPDAVKRGVVYHLDRNKKEYPCLEDVRFDKIDLKGRISLEQLNSI